jgi:hypothetical protein
MYQRIPWEQVAEHALGTTALGGQEFPRLLMNDKTPPLNPVLGWLNPVHLHRIQCRSLCVSHKPVIHGIPN